MTRRDESYLSDIIEAAGHIAAFLGEMTMEDFAQSELVRSALAQKLAIIGEAAAPSAIFWSTRILGSDWNEVWNAYKIRCPVLRGEVAGILDIEFGGPK